MIILLTWQDSQTIENAIETEPSLLEEKSSEETFEENKEEEDVVISHDNFFTFNTNTHKPF